MYDLGHMIAITTSIAIRDYYNDKVKLEQQKQHEYRRCYEGIADRTAEFGELVVKTLKASGRVDLEKVIAEGMRLVPFHIFMKVWQNQDTRVHDRQIRLVEIAFRNINGGLIDKNQFINKDEEVIKWLDDKVGLKRDHCGEFWNEFIPLIFAAEMDPKDFEKLMNCYADIAYNFAILGDCKLNRPQHVVRQFADGINQYMKAFELGIRNNTQIDLDQKIMDLRVNCELMGSVADDSIFEELFEFFVVALTIGYLEETGLSRADLQKMLQHLLSTYDFRVQESAAEIYEGIHCHEGMCQVYYDSANSWTGPNYWLIHMMGANESGSEDLHIAFIEAATEYLQLLEALLIEQFSIKNLSGVAVKYMGNVVRQLQMMV